MLEAYEATRNLDIVDKPIETPVAPMVGKHIASPAPIIVPVLRAGLGMLDGMTKMIPTAEVGFLGMKRDEEHPTQQITYANRLPRRPSPAVSASSSTPCSPPAAPSSPPPTTSPSAAPKTSPPSTSSRPEGIQYVQDHIDPSIAFKVVVCAVDEKLNEKAYIVPGLGDAGDRLYGVID